jgi:hypothetical protein
MKDHLYRYMKGILNSVYSYMFYFHVRCRGDDTWTGTRG